MAVAWIAMSAHPVGAPLEGGGRVCGSCTYLHVFLTYTMALSLLLAFCLRRLYIFYLCKEHACS